MHRLLLIAALFLAGAALQAAEGFPVRIDVDAQRPRRAAHSHLAVLWRR